MSGQDHAVRPEREPPTLRPGGGRFDPNLAVHWHGWMQSQPDRRLKDSVETADDRSPLALHLGGIDDSVLGMVGQW